MGLNVRSASSESASNSESGEFPFGANVTEQLDPPPPPSPATEAAPDPFDPASLRISEDSIASLGVKEALISLRCRKPGKAEFVRVHPD
uniref:hypothetical protein n=1 Tax=Pseudomonas sp. TaxID=306 RepID=UPI003F9E086F